MGLNTKQGLDWNETMMESTILEPTQTMRRGQQQQPQPERLECPRCASSNTKFCYYNNYNKSQPRHYCKACKRHWTKGGTLRNVPVGGVRKHKRSKVSKVFNTTIMVSEALSKGGNNGDSRNYLPFSSFPDQKSVSNTLFDALNHHSSSLQNDATNNLFGKSFPLTKFEASSKSCAVNHDSFSSSMLMPPQDQSIQFSFSNNNLSSNFSEQIERYDTSLESTINTMEPSQPWQTMDVPDSWSWNDINTMVSADLELSWNDTVIKF